MCVSCAEKMCKLNVQTEISLFCCRTCKPYSFSLPTTHTQRNPMIQRGMDEQNNGRLSNVMKIKNEINYFSVLPFWLCDSSIFSSIGAGYSPFVSVSCEAV